MTQTDQTYGILEAAKILQVTDKTIRNYINRGFLKPDKWNGSWRISYTEISELFWKKFGKKMDRDMDIGAKKQDQIEEEKSEFEERQRNLGKLAALESNEKALRTNIQELNERNGQLEGSAASGWTEARMLKEDLEKARTDLAGAREAEMKAREDSAWLRRELVQARRNVDTQDALIQDLRAENHRLSIQIYERAVGL